MRYIFATARVFMIFLISENGVFVRRATNGRNNISVSRARTPVSYGLTVSYYPGATS